MGSRRAGEEGRLGFYDLGGWGLLSDFLVLLSCADADVFGAHALGPQQTTRLAIIVHAAAERSGMREKGRERRREEGDVGIVAV